MSTTTTKKRWLLVRGGFVLAMAGLSHCLGPGGFLHWALVAFLLGNAGLEFWAMKR